MYARKPN